jgi:hypothetical protein
MIDRDAEAGLVFYIYSHPEEALSILQRCPPSRFGSHCRILARGLLALSEAGKPFRQLALRALAEDVAAFEVAWKLAFTVETPCITSGDAERAVQAILEAWRCRGREYHANRLVKLSGDREQYMAELNAMMKLEEEVLADDLPAVETLPELNAAKLRMAASVLGTSLLNECGLMWIHAADGAGKTLLALQLAASMASEDVKWLGYTTGDKAYRVLYLQGELSRSWWQVRTRRLKAWADPAKLDTLSFCHSRLVIAKTLPGKRWSPLMDFSGLVTLGKLVDKYRPEIIFLDPLGSFYGLEENSTDQNREFINRLLDFRRERDVTMVLVHHDGKPQPKMRATMRGSSTLRGAGDCSVVIDVMAKGKVRLRFDKVRHAATPEPMKMERTHHGFFEAEGTWAAAVRDGDKKKADEAF